MLHTTWSNVRDQSVDFVSLNTAEEKSKYTVNISDVGSKEEGRDRRRAESYRRSKDGRREDKKGSLKLEVKKEEENENKWE